MKFPISQGALTGLTTNSALLAMMLEIMIDKGIITIDEATVYFEKWRDG